MDKNSADGCCIPSKQLSWTAWMVAGSAQGASNTDAGYRVMNAKVDQSKPMMFATIDAFAFNIGNYTQSVWQQQTSAGGFASWFTLSTTPGCFVRCMRPSS
jgi:hypothetical protein